jgi:hypothetical protein
MSIGDNDKTVTAFAALAALWRLLLTAAHTSLTAAGAFF